MIELRYKLEGVFKMIKKIMIENYLSIGEKTFIFNPNDKINILYGENGAGKTNFIIALKMIKEFVINGATLKKTQNKFIQPAPTKIFIETMLDEKNYFQYFLQYGVNKEEKIEIEQEYVVFNETVLIDRKENKYNLTDIEEQMVKKDKNYAEKSILNKIVKEIDNEDKKYAEQLKVVYDWFKYQLILLPSFDEDDFGQLFTKYKEVKPYLIELIKEMNLPIFDIIVEENDASEEIRKIKENIEQEEMDESRKKALILLLQEQLLTGRKSYKVKFLHSKNASITYSMESSGTQKIVSNLLVIATALKAGKKIVYLSDEFDNSLHYELSKFLLNVMSKNEDIQFIGTTHNLIFLEQQEFGKKAFWFIDKDINECTTIFSLQDIVGLRSDNRHNWRKMYQDYRFGAYPQLNSNKGE